jgi:hypothetical protein
VRYFANLAAGKIALWCFLIWYLVTVIHHFDATPAIWLNALGIGAIIGVALYLSVHEPGVLEPGKPAPDRWTTARLFMMPFCVSSFSQLIKGRGFVLIFPPDARELAVSIGACAAFVIAVLAAKQIARVGAAPKS